MRNEYNDLFQTMLNNLDIMKKIETTPESKQEIKINTEEIKSPVNEIKKKQRCLHCRKKLLMSYECKCGNTYCLNCTSFVHDCKFDYAAERKKLLAEQNILIQASKITKI